MNATLTPTPEEAREMRELIRLAAGYAVKITEHERAHQLPSTRELFAQFIALDNKLEGRP